MRKSLLAGLGLVVLGLVGCDYPRIVKTEDVTGDGRTDVIVEMERWVTKPNRWLFVQREDGSFSREEEKNPYDLSHFGDFFFDGQIYRKVVKPNSTPEKK